MGYCPFSSLVSRYNVLYRDKQGHRHAGARSKALRYDRGGLRYGRDRPRHDRPARGASNAFSRMTWPLGGVSRYNWAYRDKREAWLLEVSRDTNFVSLRRGGLVLRHSARHGCDTAQVAPRYGAGSATIRCRRLAIRPEGQRHCAQQLARGRGDTARAAQRVIRPSVHRDTTTTQHLVCHDTAGPTHSVCAAWVRVCTLCTQPSLDSVHCFESLFGTLFMGTVHVVLKK